MHFTFITLALYAAIMNANNVDNFRQYVTRYTLPELKELAGQNPGHAVSYIGRVSGSAKLDKSYKHGVNTYGIYLAPATMSGHNVCPSSKTCAAFCLVNSGQARIIAKERYSAKTGRKINDGQSINAARVRRTWLFFDNRPLFMAIVVREIDQERQKVNKYNETHRGKNRRAFAVRLNCTSDINPLAFHAGGLNILDIFANVQFYDYTKVAGRLTSRVRQYKNYDITFSYDGTNGETCRQYLADGGRIAVVFDTINEEGRATLPESFEGYPVTSGDNYDMRYTDPAGVVGLTYHRTAGDYKNGEYKRPVTPFVVNEKDVRVIM